MLWMIENTSEGFRHYEAEATSGAGGSGEVEDAPKDKAQTEEKGEDTGALKRALEREREQRKELAGQLKEYREQLATLQESAGSAEELKKQLAQTGDKIASYELRDQKRDRLREEAARLRGEGINLDVDKAEKFLLRVESNDIDELLKEAAEMFGSPAEKADPEPTNGKPGVRVIKGQPENEKGGAKTDYTGAELTQLWRDNPEGYQAVVRERRAGNKFLAHRTQ